eukprot:CAMPEP_0172774684 /NCGR_PEP_ID=MMETSP1074-20121228/196584_1 /TAXON_ID=2916 /ORGANISM="Ceratium fusus, Strain PA161109" /LENGTH=53 /DNA_ID=CAMNT_0013611171 /DNA_START=24 /DNA_END=185 /DNA_ORIENTATION=+
MAAPPPSSQGAAALWLDLLGGDRCSPPAEQQIGVDSLLQKPLATSSLPSSQHK